MEEKTHPEVVAIDDDDEDHVKPLKVSNYKQKTKASSKDVIVYIPDDDESPVYTTTFLARYPFEFGPGA